MTQRGAVGFSGLCLLVLATATGACGGSGTGPAATAATCRVAVDAAASASDAAAGSVRAGQILESCPDRTTIDRTLRQVAGSEDVADEDEQLTLVCRSIRPVPGSCAGFAAP